MGIVMKNENIVEKFLKHRDFRVEYQRKLIDKYKKPLVSIRVNYPGGNKDNLITRKINQIISDELIKLLDDKIIFGNIYISLEGPISILVVNEHPIKLKKLCINIEEHHKIGRLVDVDVYDENYCGISRTNLGRGKRKCFICNDLSFICSRSKKHSEKEIKKFIENTLNNFI